MLPFRAKRISCLAPLAHNRSGVFGANWPFLAPMSCVKVFRSTFKANYKLAGLALVANVRVL